jgi:L-lactate dehydrogenase complex protein LldG
VGSKQAILGLVRANKPESAALPKLDNAWVAYADRQRQFAAMIESVGGRCLLVANLDEINRALAEIPAYASAKQIVSLLPGAGQANFDPNSIDDPHALAAVDFAILSGQFGVAENGAIWVSDTNIRHRAIYFIAQHLALVIPADQIVDNMHQAYKRLSFPQLGYGAFISGPSKTADIEQSLVIGAHGPRSLTVFCLQPPQTH